MITLVDVLWMIEQYDCEKHHLSSLRHIYIDRARYARANGAPASIVKECVRVAKQYSGEAVEAEDMLQNLNRVAKQYLDKGKAEIQ